MLHLVGRFIWILVSNLETAWPIQINLIPYIFPNIFTKFLTWAFTYWLVYNLQWCSFSHSLEPISNQFNPVCIIKSSSARPILLNLYLRLLPGLTKLSYMHIIPLQYFTHSLPLRCYMLCQTYFPSHISIIMFHTHNTL